MSSNNAWLEEVKKVALNLNIMCVVEIKHQSTDEGGGKAS